MKRAVASAAALLQTYCSSDARMRCDIVNGTENNMFHKIMEDSGIPLLLCLVCLYYVFRLWAFKDTSALRPKDAPPLKDKDGYCREAGILLLLFFGFSLLMAVLLLFNALYAVMEIFFGTVLVFLLWKRMENKYTR